MHVGVFLRQKTVIFVGLLFVVSFTLLSFTLVFGQQANTTPQPWPKFRYDERNTGQSPYDGPQTNELKWKLRLSTTGDMSSPSVDLYGTIYIAGGWGSSKLYAVKPNGTLDWVFDADSPPSGDMEPHNYFFASPTISEDGTIYIGSLNHIFYAFWPDGAIKWRFTTSGKIYSSATISSNGMVYIGSWDGNLYAIGPNGAQVWCYDIGRNISATPAIGQDGTIYVGSDRLYAINPDGTLKWVVDYSSGTSGQATSPAIDSDGTIYTSSGDDFAAVNCDGTVKWIYNFDSQDQGPIFSSPAIAADGTIYVGTFGGDQGKGKLYALNRDGTVKWSYKVGEPIYSSPAIGADGTIYFASQYHHTIIALSSQGDVKWEAGSAGTGWSSPAVSSDGIIYIGEGGCLYAFGPNTTQPHLVIDFSAADGEDRQSILTWTNPSDSDLSEVLVKRKIGSYPTSHTDGLTVYRDPVPRQGSYVTCVDTELTNGTVYYYAVFSKDYAQNWNDSVQEGDNADTGIPALGNGAPIASASDISGQPQTMHPDTAYTVTAKYFDPDGREDLKHCYLRLNRPTKSLTMMWYQADSHAAPWAGEEGENYLTNVNVIPTEITDGNGNEGYELTWTFQINDQWPEVENAIDFGVFASDDEDLESGWDYDNSNASFIQVPTTLSLRMVDPIPELIDANNSPTLITDDTFDLSYDGRSVTGVAADGVARLVLRVEINPPTTGNVTLSIEDPDLAIPSSQSGTLSNIDGTESGTSITVPVNKVGSSAYALAVYRSPEDFVRPEMALVDEASRERQIYISADCQGTQTSFPIRITRPPVVLIHGLWGSRSGWDEFGPLDYEKDHITHGNDRFWIRVFDYKNTNDESFDINSRRVFAQTMQTVRDYKREENVAAVQVDAVTHSMGGDLARAAYQLEQFKKAESNFNAGYFHKVINIGTPHFGSPWAATIIGHAVGFFKSIFGHTLNIDPTSDALKDLAWGSSAIQHLTSTEGPLSHNIVGTCPEPISIPIDFFLAAINHSGSGENFEFFSDIFDGQENDLIVGADSQRGGFAEGAATTSRFSPVVHSGNRFLQLISPNTPHETQDSFIIQNVIQLLNQPLHSNLFAPLPVKSWPSGETAFSREVPRSTEGGQGGITISSLQNGTLFRVGETVTVTVQPTDGVSLDMVFLGTSGFLLLDDDPPFQFTLELPDDTIGPRVISVLGVDASSNTYLDEITISVVTSASLTNLEVDPEEIEHLQVGDSASLHVWGDFSDGQSIDLTEVPATSYSSDNNGAASVGTDGVVTGIGKGSAVITVTYGDRTATANVNVETSNERPIAEAGPDQTVALGHSVRLDGSESSDPDADPLAYTWEIVSNPGGSNVALSNPGSVNPAFVPDVAGQYIVKLIVDDGNGGTDSDTILVTAVETEELVTTLASAGWHMTSLPGELCAPCVIGEGGDLICALNDDFDPCYIFHYDPGIGGYIMAPPAENIPYHAGMGFWTRTYVDNVAIDAEVQVPTEAVEIPLGNGWNQIGNPFNFAVAANAMKVHCGDTELSLTDAQSQGWVSAYLFGYDTASGSYVMLDPTTGCLQPWNGYWMRAYQDDCVLIISPTECSSSAPAGQPFSMKELQARGLELPPPPPNDLMNLDVKEVLAGLTVRNVPNPIRSEHTTTFKVEGKGADLIQAIRVGIYDLSGHKVFTQDINAKALEWHTDNEAGELLANGVYLYQVWVKIAGLWYPTCVQKLAVVR